MDKGFVTDTSNTNLFVGTRVVTSVKKQVSTGRIYGPGTAGIVKETKSNGTFIVEFPDNGRGKYIRDELKIRRRTVAEDFKKDLTQEIEIEDVQEHVVYECISGSHAFGLNREGSDIDYSGVYVAKSDWVWSFTGPRPEVSMVTEDEDRRYWEIEKFMKMMLSNNPSVIDILYSPKPLIIEDIFQELIDNRDRFLSKHVYHSFGGYVKSQYELLYAQLEKKGEYRGKHAGHCLRLLMSGTHLLKTGEPMINVGDKKEELLKVINKEIDLNGAMDIKDKLHDEFIEAFEGTDLPDKPDYLWANEYLVKVRRWKVENENKNIT